MKRLFPLIIGALAELSMPRAVSAEPLIVVEDRGGDSALPYYSALKLQPRTTTSPSDTPLHFPKHVSEADMLPVRSARLSPGIELPRPIVARGLRPLFLIGDDERSRDWLQKNTQHLLTINALGFIVNVENAQALTALRALAPGLTLVPASGDNLAQRLHLRHYPVLITATAIEQ